MSAPAPADAPVDQIAALRRLARAYRRILALAVPAAIAGCQGTGDMLAPDSAAPAAQPEAVEPSAGALAALASDRIVFSAPTADGGSDIWTMSPTGTGGTRLTSFTGWESNATWSPDHAHVAFERHRNGILDIEIMDADGTHKHWARSVTTPYQVSSPSWSPDGKKLLVSVWVDGVSPYAARLTLATGNLELIAPAGRFGLVASYPIYAKDGTSIFYLDGSLQTIKRFTPGGADATVLVGNDYMTDLELSPDGNRLAYSMQTNSGNFEIYTLNLSTKVVKRLTNADLNDLRPTWSPDGTKIAFSSNRTGTTQIYTMNSSTGGGLTKITSRSNGAYEPSWLH